MANLTTENITLVTTAFPAPYQGVASSEDYNDFQEGVLLDLISIAQYINTIITPMLSILPDTAATGLQGSSIYGDTTDQTNLFFDQANKASLTLADSLRQLNTLLGNQSQTVNNLAAQVGQLQQQLSANNQYDVSVALNAIQSTLAQIATEQIAQDSAISTLQGQVSGTTYVTAAPAFISEAPSGAYPGTTYTLTHVPLNNTLVALYMNAGYVDVTQYSVSGQTITLNYTTASTDKLYAVYFQAAAPGMVTEVPTGTYPGTAYTLSHTPANNALVALYLNSGYVDPSRYYLTGQTITLTFTTASTDHLYAVYFD